MAARAVPAIAAAATLLGTIAWSNAALLVGLGLVALAGSVGRIPGPTKLLVRAGSPRVGTSGLGPAR